MVNVTPIEAPSALKEHVYQRLREAIANMDIYAHKRLQPALLAQQETIYQRIARIKQKLGAATDTCAAPHLRYDCSMRAKLAVFNHLSPELAANDAFINLLLPHCQLAPGCRDS